MIKFQRIPPVFLSFGGIRELVNGWSTGNVWLSTFCVLLSGCSAYVTCGRHSLGACAPCRPLEVCWWLLFPCEPPNDFQPPTVSGFNQQHKERKNLCCWARGTVGVSSPLREKTIRSNDRRKERIPNQRVMEKADQCFFFLRPFPYTSWLGWRIRRQGKKRTTSKSQKHALVVLLFFPSLLS